MPETPGLYRGYVISTRNGDSVESADKREFYVTKAPTAEDIALVSYSTATGVGSGTTLKPLIKYAPQD